MVFPDNKAPGLNMNSPKPPWTLTGRGFSTACLFRLSRVQSYVPSHFHIQQVLPGYTLGGYYGLHYDASPIGPYDELIIFPALVSFGGKTGFYVSHSYVNREQALQGGMQYWGKPRELRRFEVAFENHHWQFEMFEAGEVIFAARGRVLTPAVPFNFSIPFLDDTREEVVWYSGLFDTQLQFSTARLKINPECAFGQLARARHLVSVGFRSLRLVLGEPSVVKEAVVHQPAYAAPVVTAQSRFGTKS
jgi:hypothetical protein